MSEQGTVIVATLVILKGKHELAPWLAGRTPQIQEALLVTYFKQGPSFITRYKARLRADARASVTLIPGEGCRVFHQREQFKAALGIR